MIILVVDDDSGVVAMVCETLRHLGVAAIGATNADDARESLREDSDVVAVIVDENLTHTAGTELLRAMRVEHPDVLRILMSGWVTDRVREGTTDGTIERFLEKPWPKDALPELIDWMRQAKRIGT